MNNHNENYISNLRYAEFQAYIHSRMRAKTSDFQKVLNRARPEQAKSGNEKKTYTWVFVLSEKKKELNFLHYRARVFDLIQEDCYKMQHNFIRLYNY